MKSFYLTAGEQKLLLREGEKIVIGRIGHGATIELDDDSVSREHAAVEIYDGRPFLQDTGSSNRVYLNGNLIDQNEWVALAEGDVFMIMDNQFSLSVEALEEIEDTSELRALLIRKGSLCIGREASCDITLDDPTVSREHAMISYESGKFWVEDLNSTNHTFLNGKRITTKEEFQDSDDIIICLNKISILEGVIDLKNSKAAISAVGISKKYPNGKIGLQSLSIDVPSASIVALMGPSGCGKSTLLKCLNGDNPATSGQVYIHGLPLNKQNYNFLKKKIGYVPQDDIIHRELTVHKTLYYAAKLRLPDDTSPQEIEARIDKVINSLNLDQDKEKDIRTVRVKDLSGGQRKRVSIAVELLIEPTILFLDEPTSPLDPESIDSFLRSLQKLAEEGTTIIMVTHKPEDLYYTDDVIFLMIKGYMTYYGRSKSLMERFGVEDIVQVYAKLSDKDNLKENIQKYYQKPEKETPGLLADDDIKKSHEDSPFLQWFWLVARYLEIKITDIPNLLLLILQPLVVGSLLCVIFDELQLGVLFLMAISSVWFGVSNAAKEIVGELPIYERERMFNLGINTYVLSKWVVLSMIAMVQTFIFVGVVYFRFKYFETEGFEDIYLQSFWSSALFLFYIALSASLVGLLLSSYFSTTERVMTVVPISLMPQVMLGGLVARINDPLVEVFSFFALGRWGTEGLARIQDEASLFDGKSEKLRSIMTQAPDVQAAVDSAVDQTKEVYEAKIEAMKSGLPDPGSTSNGTNELTEFSPPDEIMEPCAALDLLNYYDEALVESGKLIGSVFDSMEANIGMIAVLNIAFYTLICISLKRKDRI